MTGVTRTAEQLIEYESMLHESVQRVGRAVRNMRQEMGGFSSTTPGNGSPGGGKGGGPTVSIAADPDHDPDDDPGAVDVMVSSVESLAVFGGRDDAAYALERLRRSAVGVVDGVDDLLHVDHGVESPPRVLDAIGADRLVVFAYAQVRRLGNQPGVVHRRLRDKVDGPVSDVFAICQQWSYDPKRPVVPKERLGLLAVDLTESLCRSHLRVGERRDRSRGELCDWCYRHGPLLVSSWEAPPVELVRLHVEHGRVYAHQVDPFLRSARSKKRRSRR